MRFSGPRAQTYYFERNGAIETFLMSAVNYTLTTPADFLQQFVVAKVSKHFCCSRPVFLAQHRRWISSMVILILEQTKTGLKQASRAKSLPRVARNLCSALSANGGGSLHFGVHTDIVRERR